MQTVLEGRVSGSNSTQTRSNEYVGFVRQPGFFAIFCGVLWPAITLVIEIVTGMSAEIYIDPIPTWGHAAIIAIVPAMNWWVIAQLRAGRAVGRASLLGLAFALGVTLVYWLEFLPFTAFGPLLFWTGVGLLPMAPMVSCIATSKLWARASHGMSWRARLKVAALGIAAGVAMLAIAEVTTLMAAVGLTLAANGTGEQRERGRKILTYLASNQELARYGSAESATRFELALNIARDLLDVPMPTREDVGNEIYRATGQPLHKVHRTRRGLDDLRASDQVGAALPKLGLANSKIEIIAEPEGGYSYTQWTMEFSNGYESEQEARAEVALPLGGVVSRLTLWVNGEEREAAFAGKSEVRTAYTAVVAKRRDPVLVTMTAPGRVLVQCFPVPRHGTMTIRLGITAPLMAESEKATRYVLPHFTHENFTVDKANNVVVHASGVENLPGFAAITDEDGRRIEGELKFEEGVAPSFVLPIQQAEAKHWTRDERSQKYVVQTIRKATEASAKTVVVIDGSSSLAPFVKEIQAALSHLPDARVILATSWEPKGISLGALDAGAFSGGADSVLALEEAARIAEADGRTTIVWVHGPQPVLLTPMDSLNRRLTRNSALVLWSLQLAPGRDCVLEHLDLTTHVEEPLMTSSVVAMLASTARKIGGIEPVWNATYEIVDTLPIDAAPAGGSSHLARLWAASRVRELAATGSTHEAVQLAGKYQLVTPVSGAVVLETTQQFKDAGLQAVDKESVPMVPEPSSWALVIVGVVIVLGVRRAVVRAAR